MIYPDAGPLPVGSQPAGPEVIPTPNSQPAGPANPRCGAARRTVGSRSGRPPSIAPLPTDPSASMRSRFPRPQQAPIRGPTAVRASRRPTGSPTGRLPSPEPVASGINAGTAAPVYQAAGRPSRVGNVFQRPARSRHRQLPATAAADTVTIAACAAPTIQAETAIVNRASERQVQGAYNRRPRGRKSYRDEFEFPNRSYISVCRLLTGLLLAAWLVPAAHGDGWPFWPFNKDEKPGKPDKIIALWSDTVLTQTGRPPIRGFGGRLMFYEGKKEEPIKVEGTLMVYAFDETDRDANNTRPDRKYVFTPQQLPHHYSKSKIGHSYSVWLPWDEVGGLQKEITLIVRFQPKEGEVAVSDPCRQLLPGRIAPSRPRRRQFLSISWGLCDGQGNEGVQPASYQAPVTEGTGVLTAEWQRRHISTTTISVPSDR